MAIRPDRIQEIIHDIYLGCSLSRAFKSASERQSFYDCLCVDSSLQEVYDRAQRVRAELFVDEIIEISDEDPDPQRARNRIEARKWYAAKMQPRKYGDRIDLNVTQTVDISGALADAAKRVMLPGCYPEKVIEAQCINVTQTNDNPASDSESVADGKHEGISDDSDIFK